MQLQIHEREKTEPKQGIIPTLVVEKLKSGIKEEWGMKPLFRLQPMKRLSRASKLNLYV